MLFQISISWRQNKPSPQVHQAGVAGRREKAPGRAGDRGRAHDSPLSRGVEGPAVSTPRGPFSSPSVQCLAGWDGPSGGEGLGKPAEVGHMLCKASHGKAGGGKHGSAPRQPRNGRAKFSKQRTDLLVCKK